ncbi:unnamed protein product [Brassicogethes aeneus]|uniref:Uncharacterized protein n=1 Tax=Brassicogethes aeneus TaxID=1431903 RepID=A0A9P0AS58_BRAAE|nr:unnamed protein product [Brassicogethes aeneus]
MSPKLYMTPASSPVRSVLLVAEAINLNLENLEVNLMDQDQLTPEFLKINPEHTVPVLNDDGFILADSHAINVYLVEKYGKDSNLYPKDIKERAIVNHRLHFDNGTLFVRMANIIRSIFFNNEKSISQDKIDAILEAYKIMETFLQHGPWMAGQNMTVADLGMIATVSSMDMLVPVKKDECPKLASWMGKMEALHFYSANKKGLEMLAALVKAKLEN